MNRLGSAALPVPILVILLVVKLAAFFRLVLLIGPAALSGLRARLALSRLTALLIPLAALITLSGLITLLALLFHIVCHENFLLAKREPPRAL
jgi:hypothetical protein